MRVSEWEPCPDCGFTGPYDGHVCEEQLPFGVSIEEERIARRIEEKRPAWEQAWRHILERAGCVGPPRPLR